MAQDEPRFTLIRGSWFGLTMFPGYGACPYHSPIRVDRVEPQGHRIFEVEFFNVGYAAGVQQFRKRLRTLRRAESHLVAEETEVPDRTYVIVRLNRGWLERHWPNVRADDYFDEAGRPVGSALQGLATTIC